MGNRYRVGLDRVLRRDGGWTHCRGESPGIQGSGWADLPSSGRPHAVALTRPSDHPTTIRPTSSRRRVHGDGPRRSRVGRHAHVAGAGRPGRAASRRHLRRGAGPGGPGARPRAGLEGLHGRLGGLRDRALRRVRDGPAAAGLRPAERTQGRGRAGQDQGQGPGAPDRQPVPQPGWSRGVRGGDRRHGAVLPRFRGARPVRHRGHGPARYRSEHERPLLPRRRDPGRGALRVHGRLPLYPGGGPRRGGLVEGLRGWVLDNGQAVVGVHVDGRGGPGSGRAAPGRG